MAVDNGMVQKRMAAMKSTTITNIFSSKTVDNSRLKAYALSIGTFP